MFLRAFLPVLWLALAGSRASAECACLWQGSFADVQQAADIVVAATVTRARGNSVDLDVEQWLRGEDPGPLRVWLRTADYCRPEPERFPVDSRWVMALHRIDEEVPGGFNPHTPNVSYGRLGDYSLSSCGAYWLRLSGDFVEGNLLDAPRWDYEGQSGPVLLDVLVAYVRGGIDREALAEAAREDPELRELMLDTRTFLRREN